MTAGNTPAAPKTGPRQLNHFALFSFTPAFWELPAEQQAKIGSDFEQRLRKAAQVVYAYRIYPTRASVDFLVWTAKMVDGPGPADAMLNGLVDAVTPFRRWISPADVLWGFTRPSDYASGRPAQEIDPFEAERKPYLVIYPFAKTTDWYLMSRDARQGMMNEHIRLGREYPSILQLLLYSAGLQDHEFVVSYETDDLAYFSDLVTALRNTEVRRYTLRDTPIYTAMLQPFSKLFAVGQ